MNVNKFNLIYPIPIIHIYIYISITTETKLEAKRTSKRRTIPSHERDRIARISSLIDEQRQDREVTSVVCQSNDPIRGDSSVAIDIRSRIPVTIKTIRFYDVPYFNSLCASYTDPRILCFVSVRLLHFHRYIGGRKKERGEIGSRRFNRKMTYSGWRYPR